MCPILQKAKKVDCHVRPYLAQEKLTSKCVLVFSSFKFSLNLNFYTYLISEFKNCDGMLVIVITLSKCPGFYIKYKSTYRLVWVPVCNPEKL